MSTSYFVGPMPVLQFFQHFMQGKNDLSPVPPASFGAVAAESTQQGMCSQLIRAIEQYKLSPDIEYFLTQDGDRPCTEAESDMIEHLHPIMGARSRSELHSACKKRRRRCTGSREYSFWNVCLGVVAVPGDAADPFLDPLTFASRAGSSSAGRGAPYLFEAAGRAPANVRAALVRYAHAQLARQHRTHAFQLVLCGRGARVLRWDRAGAVVSERWDYTRAPGWLAGFVWRLAALSDAQRGWDPTVSLATRREQALFRGAVRAFLDVPKVALREGRPARVLPRAERSLDDTGSYPNWKVRVVDEASGRTTYLIIERPFVEKSRPCGRSTRVSLAYDLKAGRLVVLKDTWRSTFANLRPEAETYRLLEKHGVPNLPNVMYGGDVKDANGKKQATKTPEIVKLGQSRGKWDWRHTPYDLSIHHRVVQDVAYPLGEALSEKEFVQAMHDVLLAIETAYEQTGLIHRDLSLSNIMISPEGRGVLNDWDMAGEEASHRGVGTPFFLSIDILLNRTTKPHDLLDDLESIYWVLFHGSSYFSRGDSVGMTCLFDDHGVESGEMKLAFFTDPPADDVIAPCRPGPLHDLCLEAYEAWRLYHTTPRDDGGEWDKVRTAYRQVSFLVEKFSKALHQLKSAEKAELPPISQSEEKGEGIGINIECLPQVGKKRKAPESDTPVRRSKRTKVRKAVSI